MATGFALLSISPLYEKEVYKKLKDTSEIIEEAMNFTIKRQQRNPVVKLSIGPKHVSQAYSLRVFYTGKEGWSISINRKKFDQDKIVVSDDILAELVCRKWQWIMVFDEKDYGPVEEL